jgi:transketolase
VGISAGAADQAEDRLTGLSARARVVREHIVAMAGGPEGAHAGGSLSAADILTVLYFDFMRLRPEDPAWPGRDYFVLSKGHASAALYAVLAERGFFPIEELASYARPGSRLAGHPKRAVPGVEFPTGSLGHGLALGIGLALAAQRDGRHNRSVVLLGDGELQEGSVWEAAGVGACQKLDNLVAVVDRNGLQINGPTSQRTGLAGLAARWESFGWRAVEVDGHDIGALIAALECPSTTDQRPTAVIAHTVKGCGVPFLENRRKSHYVTFTAEQCERARAEIVGQ